MYLKSDFIPEERALKLNYVVIDNARLIKEDQEPIKDIGPIYAEDPIKCFEKCTTVNANHRCNIVEYDQLTKLCQIYDLPQEANIALKFKFTEKELLGESFITSTIESIKKQDITKEECIDMFNSNNHSIFYNYKEGTVKECTIGIAAALEEHTFAINLNSFDTESKFSNIKYQVDQTEQDMDEANSGKAGTTKQQKEGSKGGNDYHIL